MTAPARKTPLPAPTAADLLAWYDRHARRLPWRAGPAERRRGERPDPYRVWLSEVMLQQTTVAAVKGYFEAFTTRWPTVGDLAAADEEDVMKAWAGLGYYARARNLKRCAEVVATEHDAGFPDDEAGLAALPGVGVYTSAAIAAIAFDRPAAVVDGNVERVFTRLYAIDTPLPAAKPLVRQRVAALVPADRPGEFAEATMDLGATICTPKRPACALCPWAEACRARAAGTQEIYPVKAAKTARPVRHGAAFVAIRADGAVLVRRRPPRGLLGGMTEVPGSEWRVEGLDGALDAAPLAADWRRLPAPVTHTFTHFHLELDVWRAEVAATTAAPAGMWWSARGAIDGEALPSVFRKVVAAAVGK
jgi:A/G-specific adenine glycosylase